MKRSIDIVLGSVLLFLALPVIAVALCGSAVTLRSWPVFTQQRVGRNGTDFRILKVRTLPRSFPVYADKVAIGSCTPPPWCVALRRMHLDELPQLWLVVIGRMSLIGPRPEMRFLHEQLDRGFASRRTAVRPGCTGLWQISKGCQHLIQEAVDIDDFYLVHRNLKLELWIAAITAQMLLPVRTRLVSLEDVPRWALPRMRADAALVEAS